MEYNSQVRPIIKLKLPVKTIVIRVFTVVVLFFALWMGNYYARPLQNFLNPPRELTFSLPFPEDFAERRGIPLEPTIEKVYLSGYFNDWFDKDEDLRFTQTGPKTWTIRHQFPPGDQQYKYVVYIGDGNGIVWINDVSNPEIVSDNHGAFNSLLRVPDVGYWLFFYNALIGGAAVVLLVILLIRPLINWMLFWNLGIRYKLLIGLVFITLASNGVFIVYSRWEYNDAIRMGLIDQLNLIHTNLGVQGVDFEKLWEPQQKIAARRALAKVLGLAPTRIDRGVFSNSQGFIRDLWLIDPEMKTILLRIFSTQDTREVARARKAGFDGIEDFYLQKVLSEVFKKAREDSSYHLVTDLSKDAVNIVSDPKYWDSAVNLGFNLFLYPIVDHGKVQGYFGGTVQSRMYGGEVARIDWYYGYLILVAGLASAGLLFTIGSLLTRHLQVLIRWSEKILEGNYDEVMAIGTRDEIQSLAENFKRMSEGLKESFSTIDEQNRRLLAEAYEDKLTSLPNRHRLFSDLKSPRSQSLILFNIDGFQKLNDFFGHDIGDKVLIETGQRLMILAGEQARVYKISADEFVILFDDYLSEGVLADRAQGILSGTMNKSLLVDGNEVFISLSAGASVTHGAPGVVKNPGEKKPSLLLAEADMAMKSAKGSSKRFIMFKPALEIKKEYGRQIIGTQKLRDALKEGRILPYFQPIIHNKSGKITKYECLVRMKERDGEILTPDHFLDIAKKARFYPFITKVMIFKSMISLKKESCFFSLNLSMEDLQDAETRSAIESALAADPELARRMIFEIVESEQIKDYEAVSDYIGVLRSYGCQIAIDDFGTGYSNFNHLIQLKVDYLKIDASLIKNLDTDLNAQSVTRAIVRFAQELDIQTVAEYVHSKEIYDKVVEYGIDYSQGYHIGMPKDSIL